VEGWEENMKPLSEMSHEEKCREFAELNGIHWHKWEENKNTEFDLFQYYCAGCDDYTNDTEFRENPSFSHAAELLEVMQKRKDWYISDWREAKGFIFKIGEPILVDGNVKVFVVELPFVMNNKLLLDACLEWSREHDDLPWVKSLL
jgi:hypothetical protein